MQITTWIRSAIGVVSAARALGAEALVINSANNPLPPAEVPEPTGLVLFGAGLIGVALLYRRRRS